MAKSSPDASVRTGPSKTGVVFHGGTGFEGPLRNKQEMIANNSINPPPSAVPNGIPVSNLEAHTPNPPPGGKLTL